MSALRRTVPTVMILAIVAARSAMADVTLTVASVLAAPDSTVMVAVDIASSGGSLPTSLNFDLWFDADRLSVSPGQVICGAACAAAQKLIQASLLEPGRLRVIVFGLNATPIPDGELVGVPFAIAASAATGLTPVEGRDQAVSDASASLVPSVFVNGAICIGAEFADCACGNGNEDPGEECGESGLASCADDLLCVQCRCRHRGDCALNGGGVDLFDVLAEIDMVLVRISPDATQRVVCDGDCNEQIDLFDVLTGIDVVLGRRTLPLRCSVP